GDETLMDKTRTAAKSSKGRRSRGAKAHAHAQSQAHESTELLLQQLHQVQEELESHYLKCLDLDAELQLAKVARDDAIRETDALRMQLAQMQRELGRPGVAQGAPAGLGGRFARLLTSRLLRKRSGDDGRNSEIE